MTHPGTMHSDTGEILQLFQSQGRSKSEMTHFRLPASVPWLLFCNKILERLMGGHEFAEAISSKCNIHYYPAHHSAAILAQAHEANNSEIFCIVWQSLRKKPGCNAIVQQ